jgi:hypothetical protein
MTAVYAYLFALANMSFCLGIFFVCLCRLHVMNRLVLFRVRVEYAIYIGAAVASALSPMWGEWPEWGQTSMAAGFLLGLLLGGIGWRDGPPESTTQPAPLE